MGEEHLNNEKNCGEISSGELRRGGTRDPIIVDISTTRHLGHGGCISGSGEDDPENFSPLYFLQKDKIHLTHHRRSKYNDGQEIRIRTHESSDISERKLPKVSAIKRGADSGCIAGRSVLPRQLPSEA